MVSYAKRPTHAVFRSNMRLILVSIANVEVMSIQISLTFNTVNFFICAGAALQITSVVLFFCFGIRDCLVVCLWGGRVKGTGGHVCAAVV